MKIDLVTPGPNTDGGSSAHGFGAFSLKLANNGANTNMTEVLNISAGANATFAGQVKIPDLLVNCNANINSSSEKLSVSGMSLLSAGSDSAASLYVKNTSTTTDTFQPYIYLSDPGGNRAGFGVETSTARLKINSQNNMLFTTCLLYTSPSPRDGLLSRMPSSA